MSANLLSGYVFESPEQWDTCLFLGMDPATLASGAGLRSFIPFGGEPVRFPSQGSRAPVILCGGEILWRDDAGHVLRLPFGDETPITETAPFVMAQSHRFAAGRDAIWGAAGSLQLFQLDGLARQLVLDFPGSRLIDIVGDRRDGVFVLLAQGGGFSIAHIDCAGQETSRFALTGTTQPDMLTYLSGSDRLVVFSRREGRLYWFAPGKSEAVTSLLLNGIRSCFTLTALGSDGVAKLFLGGTDGAPLGGGHHVISLDAEGILLTDLLVDAAPTGIAAGRNQLVVTTKLGLERFAATQTLATDAADMRATLVTPVLQAPFTTDKRPWLRVEATADLPDGSAMEIAFASTDDPALSATATDIINNPNLTAEQRFAALQSQLSWRTYSFNGGKKTTAGAPAPLAAPLFDVGDRFLLVSIALITSAGGTIPTLSKLAVFYPGRSLMENLPGIYRRDEARPGSFIRALVGVLETTTQSLDERIGDIGRNLDPSTAPGPWLDYMASWLGLPWDDALSLDQKRALLKSAPAIASGRGTRAGLQALLAALIPGSPPRFRIVDSTVDFGIALVGGGPCGGSPLPAMLAGLPSSATELNNKAILGKARLPCGDPDDGTARLLGRIRIDISATAQEQAMWEPWLARLVNNVVPATTRVTLHWRGTLIVHQTTLLGQDTRLTADPVPHLGTDAVIGIARLPEGRGGGLSGAGYDSVIPLH